MTKRVTVLLAEDHQILLDGLRILIQGDSHIQIIGEAKTGREAVLMADEHQPDVIILDIAMPMLNGIQAARQILKNRPGAKIMMLSAHADPEYVDQVMAIGVVGYLTKQASAEQLTQAILEVYSGGTFFSPSVARHLRDHYNKLAPKNRTFIKKDVHLTTREAELLQLIAEGHVNKQIASELNISIKTVEKHRQNLMEKLHIHEIAGLTRFAIAAGVIESSVQPTTV